MTRLGLRARFALLAALLVLVVGALVAATGYVAMRASLLGQAERQARDQSRQLAALIEVPGAHRTGDAAGNLVDIEDPSLSHDFARAGLLVLVSRPDGRLVQASRGAIAMRESPAMRLRCLGTGEAAHRQRDPPLAVACRRIGRAGAAAGLLLVGAPLRAALDSLARLRAALLLGLAAGVALAALAALVVARRALRPARRIAETAESIRLG